MDFKFLSLTTLTVFAVQPLAFVADPCENAKYKLAEVKTESGVLLRTSFDTIFGKSAPFVQQICWAL